MINEKRLLNYLKKLNNLVSQVKIFSIHLDEVKQGKDPENFDFTFEEKDYDLEYTIDTLSKIIFKILKVSITNDANKVKELLQELQTEREHLKILLNYNNIKNTSKTDLQYPFMKALILFQKDLKHDSKVHKIMERFPENCPWDLNCILNKTFIELIELV